ncbi:MAG: hypothetical protein GX418_07190 [Clostridiales bacterium]|nr:hypothetical protein [Clostridiales bacterium]
MKRNGCAYLIVLLIAVGVISGIVNAVNSNKPAQPTTTPKPAVLTEKLSPYLQKAEALAKDLGTEKLSSTRFNTLSETYGQADYEGVYDYYRKYKSDMLKSCWAMNNVGLAMMQLGQYEEALTLYFAINLKTKGNQAESLINLLVAGHALSLSPGELMDAAGMDAQIFESILKEKKYTTEQIDSMIETLCYNILYMRMEESAVGMAPDTANAGLDLDALLSEPDPSERLMAQLRTLSDDDRDVRELLAYFEALLAQRKESSAA